jgi:hypothetical protein
MRQSRSTACERPWQMYPGPPDAGNPHVRWDEGGGAWNERYAEFSHVRGNPDTEVTETYSNQALSYSTG